jgi:hypothetical protein
MLKQVVKRIPRHESKRGLMEASLVCSVMLMKACTRREAASGGDGDLASKVGGAACQARGAGVSWSNSSKITIDSYGFMFGRRDFSTSCLRDFAPNCP